MLATGPACVTGLRMSQFPPDILAHFAPFHGWLDQVKKEADPVWSEGGLIWSASFAGRRSDLSKETRASLKPAAELRDRNERESITRMWSLLYWQACGLSMTLQEEVTDPAAWAREEERLTGLHMAEVAFILPLFLSANATAYAFASREDPVGLSITTTTLFQARVLRHEVTWSID